jgi:hypothetical protein
VSRARSETRPKEHHADSKTIFSDRRPGDPILPVAGPVLCL